MDNAGCASVVRDQKCLPLHHLILHPSEMCMCDSIFFFLKACELSLLNGLATGALRYHR